MPAGTAHKQASNQGLLKGLWLLTQGWGMRCDTARHLQAHVQNCAPRTSPPIAPQGLCIPPCPEVTIGLYLYRLILTNCVSINLVDILVTSLRKLLRQAATYDSPSVRRGALAGLQGLLG